MNQIVAESAIPIIQLWGNLLVPLQGDMSDAQADKLRRQILQRIHKSDTTGLVIDVSGVSVLDSHLCSLLAGIASAARLMGVRAMLCGLSPEIVMTLQAMGIELADVPTAPNLEDALERLGVSVRVTSGADAAPAEADTDEWMDESPEALTHRPPGFAKEYDQ